jgi:FkbM family methyltransferase
MNAKRTSVQLLPGATLYDPTRCTVHNGSMCELNGTVLSLKTAAEVWSYAVELPRNAPLPDAACLIVRAKMKVSRGAVGVGILKEDGSSFITEFQVGSDDDWQEVAVEIGGGMSIGSLMFRNVAFSGPSEAMIDLLPLEISSEKIIHRIELDTSSLDQFKPWAGMVPAGYCADWTGLKTRVLFWKVSERDMAIFNTTRFETHSIDLSSEHVIDWLPLVDAVAHSKGTFRMAALGAGWGRWLAAGGALAKQAGRGFFLVGVEADAEHFSWMTRHFIENGFSPSHYRLIEAAASGVSGTCRFAIGDSQAWYGQSIVTDRDRTTATRTVRAVTIQDILEEASPLDYLHMDIQGAELEVLSSHPNLLDDQVRLINIGTHSAEIEAGLQRLFKQLKWQAVYNVKIGSSMLISVDSKEHVVNFQDGAQIWRNPKLRHPSEV